jgi:hypothetical protein
MKIDFTLATIHNNYYRYNQLRNWMDFHLTIKAL